MADPFLRDGCYRVFWLTVTDTQELRRRYVGSFAVVGKTFLMLDGADWLGLPPHGERLDAAGERRLRVLSCSSSYVEVERIEDPEAGAVDPRALQATEEGGIGSYEVWVGQALFLSRSPAENVGWLRWVASRWWRFGSSGTPVFIFDRAGSATFRCKLGEVPEILAVLDGGQSNPDPEVVRVSSRAVGIAGSARHPASGGGGEQGSGRGP